MGTLVHLIIFENDSYIVTHYPKLVVLSFGFAFSQLNCKFMQYTITKTKFRQFTMSNLISFAFINFSLIFGCHLRLFPDSLFLDTTIAIAIILNTLSWFTYAYRLAHEMAELLDINILTIGKRKTN